MDSPLHACVEKYIAALRSRLAQTRRNFYMHPELSGEEQRAAQVIANRLRQPDGYAQLAAFSHATLIAGAFAL